MHEFKIAEEHIRQIKYHFFLVCPFMMLCLMGFGFFIVDFKIDIDLIKAVAKLLLLLIVIIVFAGYSGIKNLRKIKIIIYDDRIVKQYRNGEASALFQDIEKILLTRLNDGKLKFISIYQANGNAHFIFGMQQMEKILDLLKERISADVLLETNHTRVDWDNPVITMLIVIIAIGIFALSTKYYKAFDILTLLITLSVVAGYFAIRQRLVHKKTRLFALIFVIILMLIFIWGCYDVFKPLYGPELSLVPQKLQLKPNIEMENTAISCFGYNLDLPWQGINNKNITKMPGSVRLTFNSGNRVTILNPANSIFFKNLEKTDPEILNLIFEPGIPGS
ncbi:hypothetical protein ACFL35_21580, partial [Candidatus Riflebacteria bacterium]